MLKRLRIQNLAIIENVDIAFSKGFTVLTGATGAGKSLIIDSLSLLLGDRASSELIRQGEEKAMIQGEFDVASKRLEALLSSLEIPFPEGTLVLERQIGKAKSSVKANGVPISVGDLGRIAKHLADIHTQFDFVKILNPENYLEILDGFSYEWTASLKEQYASLLSLYSEQKRAYLSLVEKKQKLDEARDFYEFQLKELREAELQEGEEEAIASEIATLRNYDKVFALAQEASAICHEDFLDRLYELSKTLHSLGKYAPSYEEEASAIEDGYYALDEKLAHLKKSFSRMDYDPERLNELEQRDSDLRSLTRKYHKSIPELLAYQKELEGLLGKENPIESQIAEAKAKMDEAFEGAYAKGEELSKIRQKLAKSIEKELLSHLKDLLLKAEFSIAFLPHEKSEASLRESGIDEVDFLIETNVGEGLKPLSKVISGGEASRIMLAFKALFLKANKIATVIFDEIDTGISGEAAEAVAKKIREISFSSQVLAITHLPQVASLSDQSLLIAKSVKGGRTFTSVKPLTLEEKIEEVAHLISGSSITEKQRDYAREMVMALRD